VDSHLQAMFGAPSGTTKQPPTKGIPVRLLWVCSHALVKLRPTDLCRRYCDLPMSGRRMRQLLKLQASIVSHVVTQVQVVSHDSHYHSLSVVQDRLCSNLQQPIKSILLS